MIIMRIQRTQHAALTNIGLKVAVKNMKNDKDLLEKLIDFKIPIYLNALMIYVIKVSSSLHILSS